MTRYYLGGIKVEGFRGINNEGMPLELTFKTDAVNSVFAVNGTGKSSLFEALCYAIKGEVPKLSNLTAAEKPSEYVVNKFHLGGKATIELSLIPDDGSAAVTVLVERGGGGARTVTSPSGHPAPSDLLEALNQDFTLLDYGAFSAFVDDTPLNRGRSFSGLIGLSKYSYLRQALQTAADKRVVENDLKLPQLRAEVKGHQRGQQDALRRARTAYANFMGAPLRDVSKLEDASTGVRSALAEIPLVQPLLTGSTLGDVDFQGLLEEVKRQDQGDLRTELTATVQVCTRLSSMSTSEQQVQAEFDELKGLLAEKLEAEEQTLGACHKRMFDSVREVLLSDEFDAADTCPVCGSTVDGLIGDRVDLEIAKFFEVARLDVSIKEAVARQGWLEALRAHEAVLGRKAPESQWTAASLQLAVNSGRLSLEVLEQGESRLKQLSRLLAEELVSKMRRKEELEALLPPSLVQLSQALGYAAEFQRALVDHASLRIRLREVETKVRLRERWTEFVASACGKFARAEADLGRRRLVQMESDFRAMYARIMSVQDVVPAMVRSGQREEIQLQLSDFHGLPDLSARALLSESFRNALAIAIFLTAARQNVGGARFVILDDVTSSFDSGHQWALMEEIRLRLQQPASATGLQFIILSHDGLLQKYFDKLDSSTSWHHTELRGWPPMGNVLSQAQNTDRLRTTIVDMLSAGQVHQAESFLRQYLEFKVLQIIRKVSIPVPLDFAIKDTQKMVGNALEAIETALDLHKRAGTLVLEPGQVSALEGAHIPALVGNWVSHYETASGASISPGVLMSIVDSIDRMADCFRYDKQENGHTRRVWYRSLSRR